MFDYDQNLYSDLLEKRIKFLKRNKLGYLINVYGGIFMIILGIITLKLIACAPGIILIIIGIIGYKYTKKELIDLMLKDINKPKDVYQKK